jgi:trigger factor
MDKTVDVNEVDDITRAVKVSIAANIFQEKYEERLGHAVKSAKLKGFRPGNAPRNIVEKVEGQKIRAQVRHELISESLFEVIKEHELAAVGGPELDDIDHEDGADLSYTAKVFLYPEPTISGYDSLKVEAPRVESGTEQVDKVLERICESKASYEPLAFRTESKPGDTIEATLKVREGESDFSKPEPGRFVLGDGNLPKEVEDQLTGVEIGAVKEVTVTFPADHEQKELQGKTLTYWIQVDSLLEKKVPELTDDFVKELESDSNTVLELRVEVGKRLEEEVEEEQKMAVHTALLEKISEQNEFQIPPALVDDEIRIVLVRYGMIDPQKQDWRQVDVSNFRGQLGEMAEKRVRTSIIIDRIVKQEDITVNEDEMAKELEKMKGAEEATKMLAGMRPEQKEEMQLELARNKALEMIRDKAKIDFVEAKKDE